MNSDRGRGVASRSNFVEVIMFMSRALKTPQKQLQLALMGMAVAAIVSTCGFWILGNGERTFIDALHLTANILSTVGNWSGELSQVEKVWEVLVIVFGIGAAMYGFGQVMAITTGGQIQRMLGRRQLQKEIKTLRDHYIVCGFGRMGQSVCESLKDEGKRFVLIETDDERAAMADELGYIYINGDAADEDVLSQAGIEYSRGLVTCLRHDADNVFVTLTAHGINPELQVIARSESQATEHRLKRAGASRVICTPVIGANKVTRMLLHPALEDLVDATIEKDLAFDRIHVNRLEDLVGKTLTELHLPRDHGVIVLAIEKLDGRRMFNPPEDHVLKEDELMLVVGPRKAVDDLLLRSRG